MYVPDNNMKTAYKSSTHYLNDRYTKRFDEVSLLETSNLIVSLKK